MKPFIYKWTHESVKDFWDGVSVQWPDEYAGLFCGKHIVRFAQKHIKLDGDILDFGCGRGYMFTYLKNPAAKLYIADQSPEEVKYAKELLSSQSNFVGGEVISPTFFEKFHNHFQVIFLSEVLEHVLPEDLPEFIKNIYGLMKDQGYLIIAVPNRPDSNRLDSLCPNCGAIYNMAQHHTAWTKEKLDTYLASVGLKYVYHQETTLPMVKNELWIIRFLKKYWNLYKYKHKPDLMYLCQK